MLGWLYQGFYTDSGMFEKSTVVYQTVGRPYMPLRILLADDNPRLRSRLSQLLTSTHDGWVVCAEAENGEQAISKTIELRPDVIVLDLSMPVMDGFEAAREIGNVLGSAPIFLYTLHTSPELEKVAKKIGIAGVVCKPNWQSLLDAIESTTREDGEESGSARRSAPETSCRRNAHRASGVDATPRDCH
jgi:CheY-like chemotaxis protein